MNKNNKFGFTLVELLAVIVILAIILVIAVPKIMSVIEDAKKATLESTAMMIASSAEKAKVQNTLLSNNKGISCKDITNINDIDYERCIVEFDDENNALVTIKGRGKFDNLYVCEGNKTTAIAGNDVCNVSYGNASAYIEKLEAFKANDNHLQKTSATHNGTTYDAGIRYVGSMDEVNNKVYYNCDDTDSAGVSYGSEGYNYASSCEVWRIIGVFDVKSSTSGKSEKRIKLINTASTFEASWDSSASDVNSGYGINQWGPSGSYEGADLMRLLNGFYIGKSSDCTYCTGDGQATCEQVCTADSLKSAKMKVLTNTAKGMIENVVWNTYGVTWSDVRDVTWAPTAYLQEKGISKQYMGKNLCVEKNGSNYGYCNDSVERTISWTGLVGLMSVADIAYANGWLYNQEGSGLYSWTFTPRVESDYASVVWHADIGRTSSYYDYGQNGVFTSVYLKSNIKIIGGNGNNEPYILK